MKARKNARLIVPVLLLSLLVLPFTIKSGKQSLAVTTTVTDVKQIDAGYTELYGGGTYYATIGFSGTGTYYSVYQVLPDKTDGKWLGIVTQNEPEKPAEDIQPTASAAVTGVSATQAPATGGLKEFTVAITDLSPACTYSFRIYESDKDGEKINASDTGVLVENVKTIPEKPEKPTLIQIYKNLNDSDFSFKTDGYSDGYQVRAETLSGKKL